MPKSSRPESNRSAQGLSKYRVKEDERESGVRGELWSRRAHDWMKSCVPEKPQRSRGMIRHPDTFVRAGQVTVHKTDGTVEVREPLTEVQLRRVVKERKAIPRGLWSRIMRRDRGTCRYCFAPADCLDHVVPVALGGTTSYRNLVAACTGCNSRKGANVWEPRPLPTRVSNELRRAS